MANQICYKGLCMCLLLVALLSGCTQPNKSSVNEYSTATTICRDVQIPYETDEEYTRTEYYNETVPSTEKQCEETAIVYKKSDISCRVPAGCVGAKACSNPAISKCIISNLDTEGANFSVEVGFMINGQKNGVKEQKFIYPQSSEVFSYVLEENISSCYCVEEAPVKSTCRDVTKYKEVQKERQVMDRRPVTKYRTEQQCR